MYERLLSIEVTEATCFWLARSVSLMFNMPRYFTALCVRSYFREVKKKNPPDSVRGTQVVVQAVVFALQ